MTANAEMPDCRNGRLGARRPRGRRAPASMFGGVDLLETVEHLSIPSYAVDRQGIIFDASVSQQVAELAGRPVLIVPPPR